MSRAQRIALSFALVCSIAGFAKSEDVIYAKPNELIVRGDVVDSPDGLFRVFPDEVDLDLNRDGLSDLRFRHNLMPRSRRVDSEALELLRIAETGIRENLEMVLGMRRLAIEAANEGVNDADTLSQLQAQLDNGLDTMDRVARHLSFNNRGVLDGSYGKNAVPSSNAIDRVSTSSLTQPGSYTIDVISAAERATIEASTPQNAVLASDEVLVVNGVAIELNANMTQTQVIDRINDFASQTGVFSDNGGNGGATRLYTDAFGSNAKVCTASNITPSATSIGFGPTLHCDLGLDMQVSIGANQYAGNGATVLGTAGSEKGLAFRVGESGVDPTRTATGVLGTIDVVDNSPVFVLNKETGETTTIALPNVRPSALGLGVAGNQFTSLAELKIFSSSQANDSLAIIDHSYEKLSLEHDKVLNFLATHALPYGEGFATGLNGTEFAIGEFGLLPAGVEVGPSLVFQDETARLQSSMAFRDITQSGFVGVRIPVANGFVYSWVGIKVDGDSSLTISDYAWNSIPNDGVVTGVASKRSLGQRIPGDANMDGVVDFSDFLICSSNFEEPGRWHHGNFNGDQLVDFSDFLMLSSNFQAGVVMVSVPEPDGVQIEATLAICVIAAIRRRRKRCAG